MNANHFMKNAKTGLLTSSAPLPIACFLVFGNQCLRTFHPRRLSFDRSNADGTDVHDSPNDGCAVAKQQTGTDCGLLAGASGAQQNAVAIAGDSGARHIKDESQGDRLPWLCVIAQI